jgi:hypothetical protein
MINCFKKSFEYTFLLKTNITLTNFLNHYYLPIPWIFLYTHDLFFLKL